MAGTQKATKSNKYRQQYCLNINAFTLFAYVVNKTVKALEYSYILYFSKHLLMPAI